VDLGLGNDPLPPPPGGRTFSTKQTMSPHTGVQGDGAGAVGVL